MSPVNQKLINRLLPLGFVFLIGCTYFENEPIRIPAPEVPNPTTTLEANLVSVIPNKLNANYWKTADYLEVSSQNLITSQVPTEDGLFNVSGTFNGKADFNKGKNPTIQLRAAYTSDSLYIHISWKDTTFSVSNSNWLFNGPTDPKKSGSTTGWTSQRSDDLVALSFNMGGGKRDVWNWSLALSEPLGFAIDMVDNGSGPVADTGNKTYVRNIAGTDNRSGPKYDWDGVQQELTRKPAGFTILDPGYYLLNKKLFTGDPINGDAIYQAECIACHGVTGDGNGTINPSFVALNVPGQFNRLTRQALDAFAPNGGQHEGSTHYPTSETDRQDLFARLRGFSGIPGYYLENPSGSSSDVRAVSNVQLAKIDGFNSKGYSVLLVRALNTSNADDIAFDPAKMIYEFHIYLGDNDHLNRIGLLNQQLTFKP
ncbi:MAG TPA: hypothetical protein DIW27_04615 [Cytophagales bacterium]|nr:hypothetical protein [Cytophagales bacterium]